MQQFRTLEYLDEVKTPIVRKVILWQTSDRNHLILIYLFKNNDLFYFCTMGRRFEAAAVVCKIALTA